MPEGHVACVICGRYIPLTLEDHYISRDVEKSGLVNSLAGEESRLYDTIDCPHCGCQNRLQERKRLFFAHKCFACGDESDDDVDGEE